MSSLSLRLPDSLHRKIRQLAEQDDISINQFINKPVAEKKEETAAPASQEARPFTPEELQRVWNDYGTLLNGLGKMAMSAAMLKRMPEIRNDHELIFVLDHAGLEKELGEVKFDILAYLRSTLSNPLIQLSAIVAKPANEERKAYTPQEKFKRMAEKNPAINELKEQLGLDIEY